jgi:hypothetical protein
MLMTMWTGDSEEDEEEGGAAAGERFDSERVLAMRDGTRNENATRLWGAIEMDVNEDKVAPWKVDVDIDGIDSDSDFGCAEPEPEEGAGDGGDDAMLGMNDVTTATGCAVSRRSARIFWESPRALILLAAARSKDERFAVASATAKRESMRPGTSSFHFEMASARAGMPLSLQPHERGSDGAECGNGKFAVEGSYQWLWKEG